MKAETVDRAARAEAMDWYREHAAQHRLDLAGSHMRLCIAAVQDPNVLKALGVEGLVDDPERISKDNFERSKKNLKNYEQISGYPLPLIDLVEQATMELVFKMDNPEIALRAPESFAIFSAKDWPRLMWFYKE